MPYSRRTKQQEKEFRELAALCGIHIKPRKRRWRRVFRAKNS